MKFIFADAELDKGYVFEADGLTSAWKKVLVWKTDQNIARGDVGSPAEDAVDDLKHGHYFMFYVDERGSAVLGAKDHTQWQGELP